MKRKWWIFFAAALVAAACLFGFREPLMVRLFPKMVLSRAIPAAFESLESRFADSPMHLLGAALDPSGCQNVKMKLDTETQFMGVAHYDLELQTQTGPNRILGEGSVSTGSGIVDLRLYLDENFAALSSDSLTDGSYYGITYNTFPEDIRSYQLFSMLAGEETLKKWDASVEELAEVMVMDLTLPEISAAEIRMALLGALALKPQVSAEEGTHCYSITFTSAGSELAQKAEPHRDRIPPNLLKLVDALKADPDSALKVVFHLDTRKLTAVEVSLNVSGGTYEISVSVPEENLLRAALMLWDGKNLDRRELSLQTASDENTYREKLVSSLTRNGVQSQFTAEYSWDLSSGDMVLEIVKEGKKHPIRLNLKGEGKSFTVICQEFEKVMGLLTDQEKNRPVICTMTVSRGNPVTEIAEYKNISDWSMEDLYLLLKRLGGLVGIQMP